jgi:hypothetical protein
MCDHLGDGRFVSLVSGTIQQVAFSKRLVHATFLNTQVPSTHTPSFRVAEGVKLVTPNLLPISAPGHQRYVILGGGKTAMDVGTWLLQMGVRPENIRWIDDDRFRDLLRRTRTMAIDMETATIFAAGFANRISTGALLLVSDQPMIPEGVNEESDQTVTANYVERHIKIGIEALKLVRRRGRSVKHLRFEDDFDGGHET